MDNQSIVTLEDIEKLEFDPVKIGEKVLNDLGYTMSEMGFGYNSLEIKVRDSENKEVFEKIIGE